MRALITGATGFVGGWLARELAGHGWEVWGCGLEAARERADESVFAVLRQLDLTDPAGTAAFLAECRPEAVLHLAGMASVGRAEREPELTFRANVLAAVVLLRALWELREQNGVDPSILVVGSAEEYGRQRADGAPFQETDPLLPLSHYGATKLAQEALALRSWRALDQKIVCTRSFSHSGPSQPDSFVLPALVRRSLSVRASGRGVLELGNPAPVRDFLHVEDVVGAYRLLVESGAPGQVYNVCSGAGTSIGALAEKVLRVAGVEAELRPQSELMRPVDVEIQVGNPEKLEGLGWTRRHTLDDLIEEMILAASV